MAPIETMRNAARSDRTRTFDRSFRSKATKFAMIGVVNTGVDYCIFTLLYLALGWRVVLANLGAWVVAVTGSYVLNTYITFAAESGRRVRLRDYVAFLASNTLGFIANTVTVVLASYLVPVLVAKLIAVGASFVVNFSLSHFVVFKPRKPDDAGTHTG